MTETLASEVDLLIVGAGPVGLYAAYYAGFRQLTTAVIDSLPEPGGQVAALYPEKQIYDVAGLPGVKGRDLVDQLLTQANQFSPTFLLGRAAEKLETLPDGRTRVHTSWGEQLDVRAILVAGGIGTFTPRPLPGGAEFEGRGLTYFVPDPAALEGQHAVIVGGGDSAVDWALTLEPIAASVTVVHRRHAFRAHEHSVSLLRQSRVTVLTPHAVTQILGDDQVKGVEVVDLDTKEKTDVPCQAVVAALGFTANLGPLEEWGLEVANKRINVDSRMQTSRPFVYAAGDITDYPGKVRLIAVGFGEVATAVNNSAVLVDPDAHVFPGHSSEGS